MSDQPSMETVNAVSREGAYFLTASEGLEGVTSTLRSVLSNQLGDVDASERGVDPQAVSLSRRGRRIRPSVASGGAVAVTRVRQLFLE
jgi:hypothetical protein